VPNRSEVRCSDCGQPLDVADEEERELCGRCGSLTRTYSEHLESTVQVRTQLRWKHKRSGVRRALAEGVSGSERSVRSRRWLTKTRLVDRQDNWYKERVVDEKTGEVLHEAREPLSGHTGHGSAKGPPSSGEDPVTPTRYVDLHDQGANPNG
jgi:phage FluMu protein Com